MGSDFNQLNGGQRKILRLALMDAFGTPRELNRFLVEHDFDRLENLSADGDFKSRVFDLIEGLSKAGELNDLMAAVLKERADYPALQDLVSRLRAESTPTGDPPRDIWMVPHRQNPYFTAREDELEALRKALHGDGCAVVGQTQAISGLGGIGKTQTAVEYAYRHRDEYQAVLWIRGATEGDLAAGFGEVAQALDLAADDAGQQLAAVHGWMDANSSWLLVIDNADTPDLLKPYLPQSHKGHLLLTSRASYLGHLSIPDPLRLNTLLPEEARAFLLRRAGRKAPDAADEQAAADLAHELGFLPLALEQAGAYVAETQARFDDYLADYREFRIELMKRSKPETGNYPQGVEETWNLSFKEVERISKASGDVLRLSAFLSAERIPEELLVEGASKLGPAISEALDGSGRLQLHELLKPLTLFSLVKRLARDRSYSVHPLVQDVVRANLGEESRKSWEQRVVESLNQTFPEVEFRAWGQCARLLPHIQAFRLTIVTPLESLESASAFSKAAIYLHDQGRYAEAESLYLRSQEIYEKALGREHPSLATLLNNRASLYLDQGRYEEAEPLHQRSLEIYEKALGGEHPELAAALNNLANLYRAQGRYEEAEPLFQRSLAIKEKALGGEHPSLAVTLNNLASLYRAQGRYEEAEPLFQRSLAITEKALGGEHPELAISLNNLALLYRDQGRYEEAEPLFQRSLEIYEKALGGDHPSLAATLDNLALLYRARGRDDEAEPLFQRGRAIREKVLGNDHPDLATTLNNLAGLYRDQGRYAEAELLFQRSQAIYEKALGRDHPYFASSLNNLAGLYHDQARYAEAEPLYQRSLEIIKKALGRDHPYFASSLNNLEKLYRDQGRNDEADELTARVESIRKKK